MMVCWLASALKQSTNHERCIKENGLYGRLQKHFCEKIQQRSFISMTICLHSRWINAANADKLSAFLFSYSLVTCSTIGWTDFNIIVFAQWIASPIVLS